MEKINITKPKLPSLIEIDVRMSFSNSKTWVQQKNFYHKKGINAWSHKVPFYVTSNPYIANSYAQLIIRFIQDSVRNGLYTKSKPFYIVELGAGSGTFSYYMLKRLLELQKAFNMTDISFVYVMTDLVESNIQFWQTQSNLQPYVAQGLLDFAQFNIEQDSNIQLIHSHKVLAKPTAKDDQSNPLIVLANYVFDTLAQDVFRIKDHELQEGVVAASAQISDQDMANKFYITLNELDPNFHYKPIKLPYYRDPALNATLKDYLKADQDGSFLMPVGSFNGIRQLADIANNKLLLISTDKGYSKHFELYTQGEPDLVFHDRCFSMSVNFDAIGKYFQHRGGDYFHQSAQQSIVTSLFTLGFKLDQLTETKQAAITYLDNISHGNLYSLHSHLVATSYACNLETIIAGLAATQWDRMLFDASFNSILNQLGAYSKAVITDLIEAMPKIAANFYYLPGTVNTLANIGVVFQVLQDYKTALQYYQQSLSYFSQIDTVLYNMGLCHYFLQDYSTALSKLREAVVINPNYIMAKGWIVQIESEIANHQNNNQNLLIPTQCST